MASCAVWERKTARKYLIIRLLEHSNLTFELFYSMSLINKNKNALLQLIQYLCSHYFDSRVKSHLWPVFILQTQLKSVLFRSLLNLMFCFFPVFFSPFVFEKCSWNKNKRRWKYLYPWGASQLQQIQKCSSCCHGWQRDHKVDGFLIKAIRVMPLLLVSVQIYWNTI